MNRRELVAALAERTRHRQAHGRRRPAGVHRHDHRHRLVGRGRRDQRLRQVRPRRPSGTHGPQPADRVKRSASRRRAACASRPSRRSRTRCSPASARRRRPRPRRPRRQEGVAKKAPAKKAVARGKKAVAKKTAARSAPPPRRRRRRRPPAGRRSGASARFAPEPIGKTGEVRSRGLPLLLALVAALTVGSGVVAVADSGDQWFHPRRRRRCAPTPATPPSTGSGGAGTGPVRPRT